MVYSPPTKQKPKALQSYGGVSGMLMKAQNLAHRRKEKTLIITPYRLRSKEITK